MIKLDLVSKVKYEFKLRLNKGHQSYCLQAPNWLL